MSKLIVVVVGLFGLVPPGSDNEILALLRRADGTEIISDAVANTSVAIERHDARILFNPNPGRGPRTRVMRALKGGEIDFEFKGTAGSVSFSNAGGFLNFFDILPPENQDARVKAVCAKGAPVECSKNNAPLLAGRVRLARGLVHPVDVIVRSRNLRVSRQPRSQVTDLARIGTIKSVRELNFDNLASAALFEATLEEGEEVALLVDGAREPLIPAIRSEIEAVGLPVNRGEKIFVVWVMNLPEDHVDHAATGNEVDNHFALLYDFLTESIENPLVPFFGPTCTIGDCLPPGSQCVPPTMPDIE